jgi:hypothetical protein
MNLKRIGMMVLICGLSVPAVVLSQAAPQSMPQESAPMVKVDDSRLKEFVKVEQKIDGLNAKYQGAYKSAETPEAAASVQQKAQQEAMMIVEDSPLNMSEYQLIAQAIQTNQDIRSRYMQLKK